MGNAASFSTASDLEELVKKSNFTEDELKDSFGRLLEMFRNNELVGNPVMEGVSAFFPRCRSEEEMFTMFVTVLAVLSSQDDREGKMKCLFICLMCLFYFKFCLYSAFWCF